jgi:hypothetical protein
VARREEGSAGCVWCMWAGWPIRDDNSDRLRDHQDRSESLETISGVFLEGPLGGCPKHTVNIRTVHNMQESCQLKAY